MGSIRAGKTGIRSAFAALATAIALGNPAIAAAPAAALQVIPAQTSPSADDIKKLEEYHAASVANLAQVSLTRCSTQFDTAAKGQGPLGNRNIEKVLQLDESAKLRPESALRSKGMLVLAEKSGYAICFDQRLSSSEYASAIYMQDKLITLNPVALNPEKPVLSQQLALIVTLAHLNAFWNKGVPAEIASQPIAITVHPGSLRSDINVSDQTTGNLSPPPLRNYKKPEAPERDDWQHTASYRGPAFS